VEAVFPNLAQEYGLLTALNSSNNKNLRRNEVNPKV